MLPIIDSAWVKIFLLSARNKLLIGAMSVTGVASQYSTLPRNSPDRAGPTTVEDAIEDFMIAVGSLFVSVSTEEISEEESTSSGGGTENIVFLTKLCSIESMHKELFSKEKDKSTWWRKPQDEKEQQATIYEVYSECADDLLNRINNINHQWREVTAANFNLKVKMKQ